VARCAHLRPPDHRQCSLYIDTSGEPLFKRGWREDKGEAPLKETLAAAMIAASGWRDARTTVQPLYDPCCGSGTIAIEAAQIACNIAPGGLRRFAFEKMLPFQAHVWEALRQEAARAAPPPVPTTIFGSDVAHRMVDFAQRNAERAGVADAIEFRGGDALQRMPPCTERRRDAAQPAVWRTHRRRRRGGPRRARRQWARGAHVRAGGWREREQDGSTAGATSSPAGRPLEEALCRLDAWVLTPDLKLPGQDAACAKESRRVPMWNGPIECRPVPSPPRRPCKDADDQQ
jgi:putative N6-adenine-specific DNA methylase